MAAKLTIEDYRKVAAGIVARDNAKENVEMPYTVALIDVDGCEITAIQSDTLKEAKLHAKYLLSDRHAHACGSTHADMHTRKVEISKNGECIWDAFI